MKFCWSMYLLCLCSSAPSCTVHGSPAKVQRLDHKAEADQVLFDGHFFIVPCMAMGNCGDRAVQRGRSA